MGENSKKRYWLGVDLGGTKIQSTVFDENFKAVVSERKKTKGHEGKDAGLLRMKEVIAASIEAAGVGESAIAGIGIGCAGPLDLDNGVIIEAPNLGWKNVELRQIMEKSFKARTILVNDVDAGTYGEYRFGAGKKSRSVLGIFPGTGIGGGFVYEGKLLRGKKSSCMEIGHICVLPDGPLCGCGQRGCLEAVASRLAIASAVAGAAYRGEAPGVMEEAGADITKIRSKVLARAVERGEKSVEEIVRRAAWFIGKGAAAVVNLLSPDVILLGGGLVQALPKIFVEEVEKSARKSVMRTYRDSFEVAAATLGDDATALGAAAWAEANCA